MTLAKSLGGGDAVEDGLRRLLIQTLKNRRWTSLDAERAAASVARFYETRDGPWQVWLRQVAGDADFYRVARRENEVSVYDSLLEGWARDVAGALNELEAHVSDAPTANIDELTGRDLDAMVAERVLGLQVEPRANARTGENDFLYALSPGASLDEWVRVPYYTASMAASLNLEVELHKRGWRRVDSNWKDTGDVRVILRHTDGRRVEAFGPGNEALCRAALKAVAQ